MQPLPKPSLDSAFKTLIRYRLLLPTMIAALLTMGAISFTTGRILNRQQERFNISISYATEAFLGYASNELNAIVASMPNAPTNSVQELMETQQNIHSYFDTIYLISGSGIIEALAPLDQRYVGFDMSRQDYYRFIDCTQGVNISNTFSSLRTGTPTVYLSRCIENGYIVVGELNLSSLQEATLTGISQFPASRVMVIDQNGTLIAHPDFEKVERQENIAQWMIVQSGQQALHANEFYFRDNTFWFGTTDKVQPVGWMIVTETPFWVLYGPPIGVSLAMIAFLILIFTIALQSFSTQAQRQVVIPLQQLSNLTDALARGNYAQNNTVPHSAFELDEVQHLTLNFQNMSRAISSREKLLKESEKQYRGMVENSPDAVLIHNQHEIMYINDAARKLYGLETSEEILGKPLNQLIHPSSQAMVHSQLKSVYSAEQTTVLPLSEQKHIRFDGRAFDAETLTSSIFFDGQYQAQTIVRDISRRKDKEKRLKYLASHDYLTDLPNRFFFEEVLHRTLAKNKRTKTVCAILYLDIDQFKTINDTYGHATGDAVLKEAAKKLREAVREEDIIARIGGDEFVILLDSIQETTRAIRIAESILFTFRNPFEMDERLITVSFSVGISTFPKDGHTSAELLQRADTAMYKAKDEGKNRAKFYSVEMRQETDERIQILSYLQYALEKDEFFLVYQPQFDGQSNRCIGAEVLLRWEHPRLGTIRPGKFIDVAEETGLILPISEWVIERACEQLGEWQTLSDDFHLAVNFSNLQLKQPDAVSNLEKMLKEKQIDPSKMEIELLENIVFENPEQALGRLFELKSLGVKLAIDDFGTGYSMLGYLARFPFDHLKIDQRIAPNILSDPKEAAIVAGIVSISQQLGLNVIAEGIETQEQLNFYRSLGCQYFQGWYFSREVDAATITKTLQNGNDTH